MDGRVCHNSPLGSKKKKGGLSKLSDSSSHRELCIVRRYEVHPWRCVKSFLLLKIFTRITYDETPYLINLRHESVWLQCLIYYLTIAVYVIQFLYVTSAINEYLLMGTFCFSPFHPLQVYSGKLDIEVLLGEIKVRDVEI